jgi:hypothetical protein
VDIEVPTYMDPKLAIVCHTNKDTTIAHQAHNGAGGEWLLAPFIVGVVGQSEEVAACNNQPHRVAVMAQRCGAEAIKCMELERR